MKVGANEFRKIVLIGTNDDVHLFSLPPRLTASNSFGSSLLLDEHALHGQK
jgi:hypothetical protein